MSTGSWKVFGIVVTLTIAASGCATTQESAYQAGEPIMTAEQFAALVRIEVQPIEDDPRDDRLVARRR